MERRCHPKGRNNVKGMGEQENLGSRGMGESPGEILLLPMLTLPRRLSPSVHNSQDEGKERRCS